MEHGKEHRICKKARARATDMHLLPGVALFSQLRRPKVRTVL